MKLSEEITKLFLEKDSLKLGTSEVASIKLTCGEQRYITERIAELENELSTDRTAIPDCSMCDSFWNKKSFTHCGRCTNNWDYENFYKPKQSRTKK